MLDIYPTTDGYLADIDTPGFVQEFEAWGECPYAAGLVAIRMALTTLSPPTPAAGGNTSPGFSDKSAT